MVAENTRELYPSEPSQVLYPSETRKAIDMRRQSGEFQWSVRNTDSHEASSEDCAWMVEAARVDAQKNIRDLTRRDYKKEEICTVDLNKRFDRVRTIRESVPEVKDYADEAIDRVIIDFDDSIKETPKAAMFAAGQFKIRSYAEEIAEFREREAANATYFKPHTIVNDPMELVAETTHSLSETPSVEPYCVRHPLRFKLKPQVMFTCVFLCILGMMGWILWQNLTPSIEQKAFEDVTQAYMAAAETGTLQQVDSLEEELKPMVEQDWVKSYRLFLDVWQATHFENSLELSIDPESDGFPSQQSAAQAAWISWLIAHGEIQNAKDAFDAVPAKVWHEHPYFQTWALAQLDEVSHDYTAAAIKYERLLKTPLSAFALTQLGLMSLQPVVSQEDIRGRFLRAYKQAESPSKLAGCIQSVLMHGKSDLEIAENDYIGLKSQYRAYCQIAGLFSAQLNQTEIHTKDLAELKSNPSLEYGDYYRTQAILSSELYLRQWKDAVETYQSMDLPENHPMRQQLRDEIFQQAIVDGNWTGLNVLYPKFPKNMGYLAALRVIDQVRQGETPDTIDLNFPESLVKYGVSEPTEASSLIDEAYAEARQGHAEHALSIVRSLLSARPDSWEPLLLQAEILSHLGLNEEAAGILEQSMMMGQKTAPSVVMSSLYHARANQLIKTTALIYRRLHFEDPVLESSRCEILSRLNDSTANTCLKNLSSDRGSVSKSAWIMRHRNIKTSSKQYLLAGTDDMSFPGYHLELAHILLEEGQFKAATQAYAKAILVDKTTATPDTVAELERLYTEKQRRYEGTKQFELLIENAESSSRDTALLGALHMAAARLYQPKSAHPMARRHLSRAQELIGDQPEILSGLVQYYEAKDKPEHARTWRLRLARMNKGE